MESKPKVYFTRKITPEKLLEVYKKLGRKLTGNVGVKIHSGEHDKGHIIQPEFMRPLVFNVTGTIIECNTAYPGRRMETEKHWKLINDHGFTKYFKVDILDAEGDTPLPVEGYKVIPENFVGSHLLDYESLLVLSHFKGHAMGGFGGALKNVAIGMASTHGKQVIHGGKTIEEMFAYPQIKFLEGMADAVKSVTDHWKGKMAFLNVMKDMSIDCDCDANPKTPEIADIGILGSLDPVALDQACVDLIYNSTDKGKEALIKRMEEKQAMHLLEAAEEEGIGSRKYELIDLDL